MKTLKFTLVIILFLGLNEAKSQYGFGTNNPNPNSVLHLYSQDSTKGLVIPLVTTAKRPVAASTLQGMIVYNVTDSCMQFCNGVKWICLDSVGAVGGSANAWDITGNTGTTAGTNFLGTTDNQPLSFKVNNVEKVRIETTGVISTLNTGGSVYMGENAGQGDVLANNRNVCIGLDAGQSTTTGIVNVGIGNRSLWLNGAGNGNVGVGYGTLDWTSGYDYNTAVGALALGGITSGTGGDENVGIGARSGSRPTGTLNTSVGSYANYFTYCCALTYNNSTSLGAYSRNTASNQARVGDATVTSIGGYANWSNVSDARFKTNVKENVPGLDFIKKLRPVTYNLDVNKINTFLGRNDSTINKESVKLKSAQIQSGFIAQEVEAIAKSLGYDFSGVDAPKNETDHYGLRYAEFVVPLVKATQEQQTIIEQQAKKIKELEKSQNENKELKQRLEKLEKIMGKLLEEK